MRYGIAFDGRAPVAECLALAQAAEARGFECAWVSEHLGHRDPFVYAATLLERTRLTATNPVTIRLSREMFRRWYRRMESTNRTAAARPPTTRRPIIGPSSSSRRQSYTGSQPMPEG